MRPILTAFFGHGRADPCDQFCEAPARWPLATTALLLLIAATFMLCCAAYGKQYTVAQTPPTEDSPADQSAPTVTIPALLQERTRAYWEARVSGDLLATYQYEADNVNGVISLSQYVRRKGRIIYKRATVLRTEIVGKDKAVANLVVEAVVPGLPGTFTSEFEDEWVFINGLWYHGGDRS